MKKLTFSLSSKAIFIMASIFALLVTGVLAFNLYELKSIRRDLYAVRDDYYGLTETEYNESDWRPEVEIISQEVKELEVFNYSYDYESQDENEYETKNVRVVEVKLTNDTESVYSYYDGQIGRVSSDGLIIRSISVKAEDDLNKTSVKHSSEVSLIPGGETTIYLYFEDTGENISELRFVDNY